jgi:Fe2+ or Zn2+ uptake regulation protein
VLFFFVQMTTPTRHRAELDAQRLRSAGLRVTAPRLAVLEAVRTGDHLAVEGVAAAARDRIGSISTQAIYDVLGALVRVGLVRRIQPAGGPARFETRVADNHHHIICRRCGVAVDVDCVVSAPCLQPADPAGFVIDEAEVVFWGVCASCQAAGDDDGEERE